jgi:transketolase
MAVFARDPRVVTVDADLSSTSGLAPGVGVVDQLRALNVGIAEANMMNVGEGFAVLGYNVWVSTFCPFFDWRAMRRIAVGYQERLEAMSSGSWLGRGHGVDITFLATAQDFDTVTNGATHMGNDDLLVYGEIAHLKIISVSCPNQLLGVMRWVMGGDKGLVYLRILRAPAAVIHDADFRFEYGKGYAVRQSADDCAVIISSGRGVHEALAAARLLDAEGVKAAVIDMPSVDEAMLLSLYGSKRLLLFAEQNNGYLHRQMIRLLFSHAKTIDASRIVAINTSDEKGRPRFIHSATYTELTQQFGLDAATLADTVRRSLTVRA